MTPHRLLLALLLALLALQGCATRIAGKIGSYATTDRRSAGTVLDDNAIETLGAERIQQQYKDEAHVNLTSFNRFVLLTGEVPNEEVKAGVARLVARLPNVRGFANELTVAPPSSLASRREDALIRSSIRSLIDKSKTLRANQLSITVERGVVYLMGLLTRAEADTAARIASTTRGVRQVVRVIEYMD